MKTIHLIRHAKSSWDFPHLADHERPLNQRGEKDAIIMSNALYESGFKWPKIYCSTAQRARLTIQALEDNWPNVQSKPKDVQIMDDLYTFNSSDIWQFVSELSEGLDSVLLVGHNPAFTDFINEASEACLNNLPTCGFVTLHSKATNWQQNQRGEFQLNTLLKPKMFK